MVKLKYQKHRQQYSIGNLAYFIYFTHSSVNAY